MLFSTSFLRSTFGFIAALALAGAAVPAFASAQTYPYNSNGNCANYPYTTYPHTTYPYNNYCPPQGALFVYVQVNAPANSFYSRLASDFTVSVSGGNAYPATFQGSPNGQLISVLGSYSVSAASFQGFTPSYSNGCTGSVSQGQQTTCVVTENPVYPANYQQYPYNQYPQYSSYIQPYAPTVYVTPTYVPKLPNTGFEPQDGVALAALTVLIAMAFFSLPYVRKAFATLLS